MLPPAHRRTFCAHAPWAYIHRRVFRAAACHCLRTGVLSAPLYPRICGGARPCHAVAEIPASRGANLPRCIGPPRIARFLGCDPRSSGRHPVGGHT